MKTASKFALALAASLIAASGCKTAGSSSDKDLPTGSIATMSLQQWVSACQTALADPNTGSQSKADLVKLANTTDCATAYPVIQSLVNQYGKKTS